MVLSYSAVVQPTSETPSVISISSPVASTSALPSPLSAISASASTSSFQPIHHLVLDAGPLLSLTPLRHLAQSFHTTPQVLAELRDPKAREHWERLGLSGVDVKVENARPEAMARVVEFAKKTGDYAVLSATDLSVIALTCQYEIEENGEVNIRSELGRRQGQSAEQQVAQNQDMGESQENDSHGVDGTESTESDEEEEVYVPVEEVSQSIEQVLLGEHETITASPSATTIADEPPTVSGPLLSAPSASESDSVLSPASPLAAEEQLPSDDDDGEGDWINPSNVATHRSHDLGLVPDDASSSKGDTVPLAAACMTGDFAVQNVLLGMGLGLVGEGGKRISKVRSWVLRCHACFKICKDSSKRFCPSCGNPTLLRTTVTTSAKTGQQKIHLKKNFQYHLRGSKYTIPDSKPGRAKGQQKGGSGLVLREDQGEWMTAVKMEAGRRAKEERKAAKGDALKGWDDPDWLPEIITVGMSGKGRSGGHALPAIGHGRKNPNQARRKR